MSFSLRSTVALCGASLLSSAPSVLAQSSTWVGPATGNWNVAANWSNGVPGLGGPNEAIILGGGALTTVTLNASPSLLSLVLGPNAKLLQPNNADLTLSGLANNGLWELASTGASTDILLNADTTFSGSGTVLLGTSGSNRILGVGGTRTLTNASGHTIAGGGAVGVNSLVLVNQGLFDVAAPYAMQLDLAPSPMSSNASVLQARDGGTLRIYGSEINNTGGTLRAAAGGTLLFRSSMIHGGTIEVDPTGVAKGTFELTTFDNVTLGGYQQPDNADSAIMGTVVNNGVWTLESAGAGTEIRVASDVATLSGTGVIEMSDSLSNRIFSQVVGRTLVNDLLHAIRGSGQLGAGGLVLNNHGEITASQPSGLVIDCVAEPESTNTGELRAMEGAELLIVGTPLNNEGGMIIAYSGGVVRLQSSTITRGVIAGWEGEIRTSVYPPTLVDVEVHGPFRQVSGEDVSLKGDISHHGEWSLQGDATMCEIFLLDNVAFEGPGILDMKGPSYANRVHSSGGAFSLYNGAGHTVRGGGELGLNTTQLKNFGWILAEAMTIDTLDDPPSTNRGTMAAEEGGTLILHRSNIDASLGTFVAKDSGTVLLRGTSILNGDFNSEGDGSFVVPNFSIPTLLEAATFNGYGRLENGAELRVRRVMTNNGWWTLQSTGGYTDLLLETGWDQEVTIKGSGTIELQNNAANRMLPVSGMVKVVHEADHTITGAGRIGNFNLSIINHGNIIASTDEKLVIATASATEGLENHGLVQASGAGEMRIEGGAFTSDGFVTVKPGSSLTRLGSMSQFGGMTRIDGGLSVTGTYTQTGGLLTGDGILYGNAWIEGGSTSASSSDGGEVGSLSVYGNYGQTLDGGLIADLGVTGHDTLSVTGSVILGGALQVRLVEPFIPMPGQEFTILTAASITGTFGCIEYPAGGAYFHVVYLPQSVKLVVDTIPVIEADLDFDGVVGAPDLAILLGAWGDEPCANAICCPADLNGDGKVNAPDLALLLGDWG